MKATILILIISNLFVSALMVATTYNYESIIDEQAEALKSLRDGCQRTQENMISCAQLNDDLLRDLKYSAANIKKANDLVAKTLDDNKRLIYAVQHQQRYIKAMHDKESRIWVGTVHSYSRGQGDVYRTETSYDTLYHHD